MKISEQITMVNNNNPPGSNPSSITTLVAGGKRFVLNRQETLRLAKSVKAILDQNNVRGRD